MNFFSRVYTTSSSEILGNSSNVTSAIAKLNNKMSSGPNNIPSFFSAQKPFSCSYHTFENNFRLETMLYTRIYISVQCVISTEQHEFIIKDQPLLRTISYRDFRQ